MSVSMMSSATAARTAAPIQASGLMSSFTGKSMSSFPMTRKASVGKRSSNAGRIKCMKVWPPKGLIKFETLSYLPPLTREQLSKEVDYLIKNGWVPCLEFETERPSVYRAYGSTPGYYDGRYWTMWKLPMYGCTDSSQVLNEVDECVKEYPDAFVRIIGFDNVRQVQCISFIAHKPPSFK
ncbi:ribulose bisphosphate carboxylase small subunit, chloroplastic 1-like [Rhododendron vialii]|uniref:ribulose bisphosphate carboxylase small subunit, chloroplastic 1-like n=1 Tax=Rhododendron vialii TaxID=182163 RepID=UPI00265FB4E1|nr:ribulose bisphosphate carboxylase small subunit, chloroplastic 1-like [Rhododendron vialii]